MNRLVNEAQIAAHLAPYVELVHLNPETGPVVVRHQIGHDQALSLHGFNHYKDPGYWQFSDLRSDWHDFLQASAEAPNKRLVIIEGRSYDMLGLELPEDREAAENMTIKQGGESALSSLLASREGVEVVRPELSTADDAAKLLERFVPEEVVTFYAIRQASQLPELWKVGTDTLPYNEYIADYLQNLKEITLTTDLAGYDFSYDNFAKTHEEFLGAPPNKEQVLGYSAILRSYVDKARANDPITRICEASNYNRDIYTGSLLVTQLIDTRSIFGAYGWYHVRRLKPLLDLVADNLKNGRQALAEV